MEPVCSTHHWTNRRGQYRQSSFVARRRSKQSKCGIYVLFQGSLESRSRFSSGKWQNKLYESLLTWSDFNDELCAFDSSSLTPMYLEQERLVSELSVGVHNVHVDKAAVVQKWKCCQRWVRKHPRWRNITNYFSYLQTTTGMRCKPMRVAGPKTQERPSLAKIQELQIQVIMWNSELTESFSFRAQRSHIPPRPLRNSINKTSGLCYRQHIVATLRS